ncbi:MAG: tetratricopeptide repeat protein [Chthoniobacterales bacterium]
MLCALVLAGCSPELAKSYHVRRAERYLKEGDYEKAKIEYLNAFRVSPRDAKIIGHLGLIWFEQGAPLRAYQYLTAANQLDPENVEVRCKMATVLTWFGENSAAREEAKKILEHSPAQEDAVFILADTIQTRSDITETREIVDRLDTDSSAAVHVVRGVLARAARDFAMAEQELRQACAVEPKSSRAHLYLAQFLAFRGDRDRAAEEFKIAADLAPLRSIARIKYAQHLGANGAFAAGHDVLRNITSRAPDYIPAWIMLARIAFEEQNYEEALSFDDNALNRDPDSIDGRVLRSEILAVKGEGAKAVEEMSRLDQAFANVPLIRYYLARAHLSNNSPSEALPILKDVVISHPDYTEPALLLAETNLRLGNGQLALGELLGVLSTQPDLPEARTLLLQTYESLAYFEEAAEMVREDLRASPDSAPLYCRLGAILRRQRKTSAAREAFEDALRRAPDSYEALDQLVSLDLEKSATKNAFERVARQIEETPKAAGPHVAEGKIYAAQRDWNRAAQSAAAALALDPEFFPAVQLMVSIDIEQGKFPEAVDLLRKLVTKHPRDARSLETLAQLEDKLGDYQNARNTYEKLLAIEPDSVLASNNLALIYAEKFQDLSRALDLARTARTHRGNDPAVGDTLGWILYRQGDYEQAVRLFEASATKAPQDGGIQFHLGLARYMMGDTEAAAVAFEAAVRGDSSNRDESRNRIEFLKATKFTVADLKARVKQDPNDVVAWLRLAELHEQARDYTEAKSEYEAALKANPKMIPALLKLASLYTGPLQNRMKALEIATGAREIAPDDSRVPGVLGRIAYDCGNFEWACSLLAESVRKNGDDANLLTDYAWAAYRVGKVVESRQAMNKAVHLNGAHGEEDESRAWFLAMTSDDQAGVKVEDLKPETQRILAARADFVPALMMQARLQTLAGQTKAAAEMYDQVLRRWPDFVLALKGLAQLCISDPEKSDEAYDLIVRARKILPEDPELAQLLAEASFQRHDFAYAAELLSYSAGKKPLTPKLLYVLGMSYRNTNQVNAARETLQRALTAGLQEPFANEAKNFVEEVPPP